LKKGGNDGLRTWRFALATGHSHPDYYSSRAVLALTAARKPLLRYKNSLVQPQKIIEDQAVKKESEQGGRRKSKKKGRSNVLGDASMSLLT
jgi:hypothetical protein